MQLNEDKCQIIISVMLPWMRLKIPLYGTGHPVVVTVSSIEVIYNT